jgi:DNA-binding NtrC family response regulator
MPPLPKELRVYVVDDEDVIASTLAMILRFQGGFNARSFNSPVEALSAARSDPPDLLISDVVMPVLTGIELAVQMQVLCPQCKVMLFTGHVSTADMLEPARLNGYSFEVLSKPVHPADLLARILQLTNAPPPPLPWTAHELQA